MITRVIAIPERLLEGRGELFISLSFFHVSSIYVAPPL